MQEKLVHCHRHEKLMMLKYLLNSSYGMQREKNVGIGQRGLGLWKVNYAINMQLGDRLIMQLGDRPKAEKWRHQGGWGWIKHEDTQGERDVKGHSHGCRFNAGCWALCSSEPWRQAGWRITAGYPAFVSTSVCNHGVPSSIPVWTLAHLKLDYQTSRIRG